MEVSRDNLCGLCERIEGDTTYCPDCLTRLCGRCALGGGTCPHVRRGRGGVCTVEGGATLLFFNEFKSLSGRTKTAVELLVELANRGELFTPLTEFRALLRARTARSEEEVAEMLDRAARAGHARVYRRLPPPSGAQFVSLQLEELSIEAIFWALKSLQTDMMTPLDSQVLSRLKEAFGMKLSSKDWRALVSALARSQTLQKTANQFQSPGARVSVAPAAEGGFLLELPGGPWRCEDESDPSTREEQYKLLVRFFERELADGAEVQGGKYGCAVLAKVSGPPGLREASMGRLCALVKVALQNNVMVHRKTSVVWNQKVEVHHTFQKERIFELQKAVMEVVREQGDKGIALAQMPFKLERRLGGPVELLSLGFNKLKDFLSTMEEYLLIEPDEDGRLRAFLRPKTTRQQIQIITKRLTDIFSEYSCQIELGRLQVMLAKSQREPFDPKAFGVEDFEEFLLVKAGDVFEVERCRDRSTGATKTMVHLKTQSLKKEADAFGFPFQVILPDSISTLEQGIPGEDEDELEDGPNQIFDSKTLKIFEDLLYED